MENQKSSVQQACEFYLLSDFFCPPSAKKREIKEIGQNVEETLEETLRKNAVSLHEYEEASPQTLSRRALRATATLVYVTVIPWFSFGGILIHTEDFLEKFAEKMSYVLQLDFKSEASQKVSQRMLNSIRNIYKDFKALPFCVLSPFIGVYCTCASQQSVINLFSKFFPLSKVDKKASEFRHEFGLVAQNDLWIPVQERDIFQIELSYKDIKKIDSNNLPTKYASIYELSADLKRMHETPSFLRSKIRINKTKKKEHESLARQSLYLKEYKKIYMVFLALIKDIERSYPTLITEIKKAKFSKAIEKISEKASKDEGFAKKYSSKIEDLLAVQKKLFKLQDFYHKNCDQAFRAHYHTVEMRYHPPENGSAFGSYKPTVVPHFVDFPLSFDPESEFVKTLQGEALFEERIEMLGLKKLQKESFYNPKDYENYLYLLDAIACGESLLSYSSRLEQKLPLKSFVEEIEKSLAPAKLRSDHAVAKKLCLFLAKEKRIL